MGFALIMQDVLGFAGLSLEKKKIWLLCKIGETEMKRNEMELVQGSRKKQYVIDGFENVCRKLKYVAFIFRNCSSFKALDQSKTTKNEKRNVGHIICVLIRICI
jgi:hypothetical protein